MKVDKMKKLVFKILCFVFITSFAYANDEQVYEDTKLNFNSHKPVACSTPDTVIEKDFPHFFLQHIIPTLYFDPFY